MVFLHRVVPGGADRSYGVHVAELAGVPRALTRRAREILTDLEQSAATDGVKGRRRAMASPAPDNVIDAADALRSTESGSDGDAGARRRIAFAIGGADQTLRAETTGGR